MRKNLCVGILRETKEHERRAPLTPQDVKWLLNKGIPVEIEKSPARIFSDLEYSNSGAKVVEKFSNASLLVGIKPPKVEDLYRNKIYMVFSHTMKGQSQNLPLLRTFLKNRITLIDHEDIRDSQGKRLVYFGRFAGICGMVDSLHYLGKKLQWQGIDNPFLSIRSAKGYGSLRAIKQAMTKLKGAIEKKGFKKPFVIGITGHGNASQGAQEVLDLLGPVEVHPADRLQIIRHKNKFSNKIHKIVFLREEKIRSKDGRGFYFEEYLKHPKRFESNLDRYLQYLNMLIHTSYWDKRYPRIVTKDMIRKLSKRKPVRLGFIGDISCDINGSIELTYKPTTPEKAVFTYDPKRGTFTDGYKTPGITVMAVDNLPSELPKDASIEFSSLIRDYVYQIAAHGIKDITRHAALPVEIRKAVIGEEGKLTKDFKYLKRFVGRIRS